MTKSHVGWLPRNRGQLRTQRVWDLLYIIGDDMEKRSPSKVPNLWHPWASIPALVNLLLYFRFLYCALHDAPVDGGGTVNPQVRGHADCCNNDLYNEI